MILVLAVALLVGGAAAQKLVIDGEGVEEFGHAVIVRDFDGDGVCEIVIAGPRHVLGIAHEQGRVVVVRSGKGEVPERSRVWRGEKAADLFGFAIAAGDVNGDRHPDLLVGAPGRGKSRGAAHLFLGGKNGGAVCTGGVASEATLTLLGAMRTAGTTGVKERDAGLFGQALALGDLDGDGLADLVIAEPMAHVASAQDVGRVLVFRGRKRFKVDRGFVGDEGLEPDLVVMGRAHEGLGHRVTVADVDGDGVGDLCMGSPWHLGETGSVVVVRGRKGGLAKRRAINLETDRPDLLVRGNEGGRLSEALAAIDIDGDGTAELLASEPLRGTRQAKAGGFLHAIAWTPADQELDLGRLAELRNVATLRGSVAHERLGTTLWAGAAFGDDTPDLLVGSPHVARVVLYEDLPGLDPAPRPTRAFMPGGSGLKGFGQALAAGDVDGDGKAEVVIGAPGANRVLVY